MPPSSGDYDPLACDLTLTHQALADDIDIVEPPIVDRQDGGVTNATRFETAELRTLQCKRGIYGRRGDHVGQWHAEAEELRHRGDLVEGRAVDAKRVNIGRDGVGPEPVGE